MIAVLLLLQWFLRRRDERALGKNYDWSGIDV